MLKLLPENFLGLCVWPTAMHIDGLRSACWAGGVIQRRISVSQILCEVFVRNLFGAFKDLHEYVLDCAFAHLYYAKGFG